MAIDYAEIAAESLESIAEAGQSVTLHKAGTDDVYIPGGQPGGVTLARDIPGIAAVFGYKQSAIDGVQILQGDQRMLLAPQIAEEPRKGDTVTANGKTYNVMAVERVAPAGVPVLYKLQLRGV